MVGRGASETDLISLGYPQQSLSAICFEYETMVLDLWGAPQISLLHGPGSYTMRFGGDTVSFM